MAFFELNIEYPLWLTANECAVRVHPAHIGHNNIPTVKVHLKQHLSIEIIQMRDSVLLQKACVLLGWNGNNAWEVQGCLLFLPEE